MNIVYRFVIIFLVFTCFSSFKKNNSEKEIIENRLSSSAGTYIKEHADNSVDWYEWSPEVLEKVEKENKPIGDDPPSVADGSYLIIISLTLNEKIFLIFSC